jgi:hypothetical protein
MCRRILTPSSSLPNTEILFDAATASKQSFIIQEYDVLCGKCNFCFENSGNCRLRHLVAEYAKAYRDAPSKKSKMNVVHRIVDRILKEGGRFLLPNDDGSWSDGGRKHGKLRVGRALRDAVRGRNKCISRIQRDLSSHTEDYDTLSPDDCTTVAAAGSSGSECEGGIFLPKSLADSSPEFLDDIKFDIGDFVNDLAYLLEDEEDKSEPIMSYRGGSACLGQASVEKVSAVSSSIF